MSVSHDRLESSLQRAVQQVIARGLADPRVSGLISVTDVRVADGGRLAVCRVSILPHDREALTLKGLEHSAEHIRRRLDEFVQIAHAPKLVFELDESLKKQAITLDALARIREERERAEAAGAPPASPDHGETT